MLAPSNLHISAHSVQSVAQSFTVSGHQCASSIVLDSQKLLPAVHVVQFLGCQGLSIIFLEADDLFGKVTRGIFPSEDTVRTLGTVKVAATPHVEDFTIHSDQNRLLWIAAIIWGQVTGMPPPGRHMHLRLQSFALCQSFLSPVVVQQISEEKPPTDGQTADGEAVH
eukprot:Skav202130  [mRNA]  locus=scaffold1980:297740:300338:+ [translate_table: standard]